MAENLGNAILELKTDSKKFDKGIKKASKGTDKLEKKMKKAKLAAAALKKGMLAIGAAVVVGFGIAKAITSVTDLGDKMAKMSQKTGIAVETLSSLKLVAELGGTSIDQFAKGIKTLSKNMFDLSVGVGEEAKRAFDELGISVEDSSGNLKDSLDIIFEMADAFKDMEDGAKKSAVASGILGRAGIELIPTLNLGSKAIKEQIKLAEKLGSVWSLKDAKAAEEFTDAVGELSTALGGLLKNIVTPLISPLTKVADKFTEIAISIRKLGKHLDTIKELGVLFGLSGKSVRLTTDIVPPDTGVGARMQAFLDKESQGVFGVDLNDAKAGFTNFTKGVVAEGNKMFDSLINAGIEWADGLTSQLADLAMGAETSFADILRSFEKMLLEMVIKATLIDPFQSFLGGLLSTAPGVPGSASFVGPPAPSVPTLSASQSVQVNIIGAPEGTKTQESTSANGSRRLDVILDEAVADNMNRPGSKSNRSIGSSFNVSPILTGR